MLLAGDELGRTQHGNNNAYCQDNDIAWLDWKPPRRPRREALRLHRAAHRAAPAACRCCTRRIFLHGGTEMAAGLNDIAWFDPMEQEMTPEAWKESGGPHPGAAPRDRGPDGSVDVILLLMNADSAGACLHFAASRMLDWRLVLDSGDPDGAGARRSRTRPCRSRARAAPCCSAAPPA